MIKEEVLQVKRFKNVWAFEVNCNDFKRKPQNRYSELLFGMVLQQN